MPEKRPDQLGVVAMGHYYEARRFADLPVKEPGKHRWIATAAFICTEDQVRAARDPGTPKLMDHENLMHVGIGCWDCEQALGQIEPGSYCPARGD